MKILILKIIDTAIQIRDLIILLQEDHLLLVLIQDHLEDHLMAIIVQVLLLLTLIVQDVHLHLQTAVVVEVQVEEIHMIIALTITHQATLLTLIEAVEVEDPLVALILLILQEDIILVLLHTHHQEVVVVMVEAPRVITVEKRLQVLLHCNNNIKLPNKDHFILLPHLQLLTHLDIQVI
jgi:hypothetical protein